MNTQQMREERYRQDRIASQSESAKRKKQASDVIEELELSSKIPLSDRDYFEQIYREVG